MYAIGAIFDSSAAAGLAVRRLLAKGVSLACISVLSPGTSAREAERLVPVDDGEAPGTGAAVAGVVGGAVGLATASLVLPGVGPVVVAGLLAAALAGVVGVGPVGEQLERELSAGVPRDELAGYLAALRAGRTVVIVTDGVQEEIDRAHEVLSDDQR
ncbi:MAG TPA: hypothetical protein VMS22_04495 [Candidatus Eisenbacteria bacterium]|nr:hypothetical protein [Candidatus Eisenbacteria bacterium]